MSALAEHRRNLMYSSEVMKTQREVERNPPKLTHVGILGETHREETGTLFSKFSAERDKLNDKQEKERLADPGSRHGSLMPHDEVLAGWKAEHDSLTAAHEKKKRALLTRHHAEMEAIIATHGGAL